MYVDNWGLCRHSRVQLMANDWHVLGQTVTMSRQWMVLKATVLYG